MGRSISQLVALVAASIALAAPHAATAGPFNSVLTNSTDGGRTAALYLVGIEKYDGDIVGAVRFESEGEGCGTDRQCFDLRSVTGTAASANKTLFNKLRARLKDPKSLHVSHIVRISQAGGCELVATSYEITACPTSEPLNPAPKAVDRSWDILEKDLYARLTREIEETRATHLVIMSTGWRTGQQASIEHYEDWSDSIQRANMTGNAPIRPIYIGLSWPSSWNLRWAPGVDFANKANDADEAGLIWGNILVNRVATRLKNEYGVRVVLVGHSFGARLLSDATYAAPLLGEDCRAPGAPDLLIGLQGAFSFARFVPGMGVEGAPYARFADCSATAVFSSSRYDRAVLKAPTQFFAKSAYMGSSRAYIRTQDYPDRFGHVAVQPTGALAADWPAQRRVLMMEASDVIFGPGDAHGKVTSPQVGVLIMDLIQRYAPAP